MTLNILLITTIACTLISGQSYAQTSQDAQTKNENKLNNSGEQNKRSTPYIKIEGIKGETTKRLSGDGSNDTGGSMDGAAGKRKNAQIGKWTTVDADGKRVGRNPQTGATIKTITPEAPKDQ